MSNNRFIAWVDGVWYVSRPIVRIRSTGITPEARTWFKSSGHPVVHVLARH
jgi:hypothetical protein